MHATLTSLLESYGYVVLFLLVALESLSIPLPGEMMTALELVVALVLLCRRHMLLLGGWVATLVGGGVLDMTLKHIIQRPRPVYASTFLHSTSFSFPSGHAMGSLVGYGILAYLL